MSRKAKQGKNKAAGGLPESIAWKAYAGVGAVVAAALTRKVLEKAWVRATGKRPPEDPTSPSVHWAEAVGWATVSGTAVGVARLLVTRKAAAAWQRGAGTPPPGLEPPEPDER